VILLLLYYLLYYKNDELAMSACAMW